MDSWYSAFSVKPGQKLYLRAYGSRSHLVGSLAPDNMQVS